VGALLYDATLLDALDKKLRQSRGDQFSASVVAQKALDAIGANLRDLQPAPVPALMAKLVEAVPRIFGSKLAKGNIPNAQRYLRAIPAFTMFIPVENLFPGMLVGIKGTISPPLATYPELGVSLVKAIDDRDWEKATILMTKVFEYLNARASLSAKYGRAVFTEAIRLRGIDIKRYPRWPTKSFTAEDREKLRATLLKVGVPL
ncbi:MAG: dihydrodipicolinate synthase family protein, partial [Candidatus Binatota bacterium]